MGGPSLVTITMFISSDRVRVMKTHRISASRPCPSTNPIPTRSKLSFFDTLWIFTSAIRRVLFYKTDLPFHSISLTLRNSLSIALKHFYPLTGQLVFSPESSELEIDFTCKVGVAYHEAESDFDFFQLIKDDAFDVAVFQSLVPEIDTNVLPAPLLSIQVTNFGSGNGVVIGVSAHHVAVDGLSFWRFMNSWAEICRTGVQYMRPTPSPDRSELVEFDHQGLSKHFLSILAPSLPKLGTLGTRNKGSSSSSSSSQLTRRTFFLNSTNIQLLKERSICNNNKNNAAHVSKFVALCAHVWLCTTKARNLNTETDTSLIFAMDCRPRLKPPPVLEEDYFGNCIRPCIVEAKASELMSENGQVFAVRKITSVINMVSKEPLKDCKDWAHLFLGLPSEQLVYVGGSTRFKIYGTDFGWGRPSRVESVSMSREGIVVLSDANEDGVIQVSIALSPPHMSKFAPLFHSTF